MVRVRIRVGSREFSSINRHVLAHFFKLDDRTILWFRERYSKRNLHALYITVISIVNL